MRPVKGVHPGRQVGAALPTRTPPLTGQVDVRARRRGCFAPPARRGNAGGRRSRLEGVDVAVGGADGVSPRPPAMVGG